MWIMYLHQNMTFPSPCTSRLLDTEQELHIHEAKQVLREWCDVCIVFHQLSWVLWVATAWKERSPILIFCRHLLWLEATGLVYPPSHTTRELAKGNRAVWTSTCRVLPLYLFTIADLKLYYYYKTIACPLPTLWYYRLDWKVHTLATIKCIHVSIM